MSAKVSEAGSDVYAATKCGIKVTLIEPVLVGTVMTMDQYTLAQPARCDVALVQIRPHKQAI